MTGAREALTADAPLALVTGANRGIGREVAAQLARGGARVLLGARDLAAAAAAAAALRDDGWEAQPLQLDVTDDGQVSSVVSDIKQRFGRLDILINNAGAFIGLAACETGAAQVQALFDVNVAGPLRMIRASLPLLKVSRAPRVVNVSSTTASLSLTSSGAELPGEASLRLAYATSKAALNMLTIQYHRAFQEDPELRRVKINAATPGYTATDMNAFRGIRTVAEGASIIVRLALLPDDGPSGGFFSDDGPVPW